MSILSFSFQGDTTERITAWEREIATYERDSGQTAKVDRLERDEVVAISRVIVVVLPQPRPMDIGAVGKGKSGKGGKGSEGAVPGAETPITLLQTVLTLTKRAENVEMLVIWQVIFWNSSAQGQGWSEGQGRWQRCECCQDLLELW